MCEKATSLTNRLFVEFKPLRFIPSVSHSNSFHKSLLHAWKTMTFVIKFVIETEPDTTNDYLDIRFYLQ